ncbi:hypothetical protein GCM10009039_07490 [Halocalculus aciditolerans]|uniref:Uncharacterized protein n=1 Tax=Halocalculus aciditolerans TaxID=1383812 RepID=A0A830F0W5_9EURY|nr:hypothetical protein GCM10009039_07490 [Halocalculus aciditolerans]
MKLAVPQERRDDLCETTKRFRQAAQLVADRAFERNDDGYVITSKTKLHELTYQQVREATDGLNGSSPTSPGVYAGVVDTTPTPLPPHKPDGAREVHARPEREP